MATETMVDDVASRHAVGVRSKTMAGRSLTARASDASLGLGEQVGKASAGTGIMVIVNMNEVKAQLS